MKNDMRLRMIAWIGLVVMALACTLTRAPVETQLRPVESTVTLPAPGEPTLPPPAQAMRAAPTATPSSIPLTPTYPPAPTPTPTFIPAAGQDDVSMVEVPAGEFIMGSSRDEVYQFLEKGYESYGLSQPGFEDEAPRMVVYLDTFSIDRVEVTNRRYRQCVQAGYCSSAPPDYAPAAQISGYATEAAFDDHPAFTSWHEAQAYCQWVGKRLPTEAEWEKAARGTDGQLYPWGNEWDETRASLELAPVGGHPQGASPFGVLDMVGSAPEWTLDRFALYPGAEQEFPDLPRWFDEALAHDVRVIRDEWRTPVDARAAVRNLESSLERARAGFRCVKGQAPFSLTQVVREMLLPTPIPTLAPVSEPDLSTMVYIPAGEFIMGTDEIKGDKARHEDETPAHIVYLDAYYIDRTEVTTADYVAFMNARFDAGLGYSCGTRTSCVRWGKDDEMHNYIDIDSQDRRFVVREPRYADYPVTEVTWEGADAYCRWQGKRLPTEAEWEKAARGTDGRRYPWGNKWRPDLAFRKSYPFELHPVGNTPENASPYGVLDMFSNAFEWVADYYAEDYYVRSPASNPTGPQEVLRGRVVRGGYDYDFETGVVARAGESSDFFTTGFRCVYRPIAE